jgi:uncharacterized protein (TIGR02145 family)
MKKLIIIYTLLLSVFSFSQVGIGTSVPVSSAQLDVTSTTKCLVPPRMTNAQKNAILSPAAGLMIWCTDCVPNGQMQVFKGTGWTFMGGAPSTPNTPIPTAGNAQASIAFTAPASNGGSVITGYTVTASPGGYTATGTSSPLVVTGLTNGTSYTFTVVATNAVGSSPPSFSSAAVTPITVPDAPTSVLATAGNAQATIDFTDPTSNGGSAITGYTVTYNQGNNTVSVSVSGSPFTVTGLTNGTSYTFTVVANNAAGSSLPAVSNAVTPITVPDAPTNLSATAGNAQATIAFTDPASNGGSDITSYTVTYTYNSVNNTVSVSGSPFTVTGLTNGTLYTFTVVANNAAGSSSSSSSVSITPITVPDPPTNVQVAVNDVAGSATIDFTDPASNGGSAITTYTVTSNPSGFTVTGISSPLIFDNLTSGTTYTFTVVATNTAGNSLPSLTSSAVYIKCGAFVSSGAWREFMCYNLGVTGTQDPLSYQSGANNGTLYQWGRKTDGHEVRNSLTQTGPIAAATVSNKFIIASPWRTPMSYILWGDQTLGANPAKGLNDPCPDGFKVPSQAQWGGLFINGLTSGAPNTATANLWTWTGNGYTVGRSLYLPAAGSRGWNGGAYFSVDARGNYWSSTVNGTNAYYLTFINGSVEPGKISNPNIGNGNSVRCISE